MELREIPNDDVYKQTARVYEYHRWDYVGIDARGGFTVTRARELASAILEVANEVEAAAAARAAEASA